MGKNSMLTVVVVAIAAVVAWRACDRDGAVTQAVKDGAESAKLTVREAVLPDGNSTNNLVIRRAIAEQRERDNREWTAANIRARPDLYIEHCAKSLASFKERFEDAILEVKMTLATYRHEIEGDREKSAPYVGFLKEAKKALDNPALAYPAKIGYYTYMDAGKLRDAVRATDGKLVEIEEHTKMREGQVELLQATLDELSKGRDKVARELADVERKREDANAKTLGAAALELQDRMNAFLAGIDIVTATDKPQPGKVKTSDKREEKSLEDIFSRYGIE